MSANKTVREGGVELTKRKLKILQAIITNYVRTAEPVGSRTLSKDSDLNVSPATIRNEMSDLEEMGYLTHPHTSAGRVPSDKAYRLYVTNMMNPFDLSVEEKHVIDANLKADLDEFDKTMEHAAEILSEITNLAAFAMTPSRSFDTLNFVKLMPVDEQTVVLMIVADSGSIRNTTLKLNVPYTEETMHFLEKNISYTYRGRRISEVLTDSIIDDFNTDIEAIGKLAENIMPNFMRTLASMLDVQLFIGGLGNIFNIPEYSNIERAKNFLSMLDRKDELMRQLIDRDEGMIVTIGDENTGDGMSDCSLITATYHVNGKFAGKIGVIGPTRMRYSEITSIVEYITDNLNEAFKLEEDTEGDRDDK